MSINIEFESTAFTGNFIKLPEWNVSEEDCTCEEDGFAPCPCCLRSKKN